jgi:hypothetical protein
MQAEACLATRCDATKPDTAHEAARPDRSVGDTARERTAVAEAVSPRPGTQECVRHEPTEIVARGEDIQI